MADTQLITIVVIAVIAGVILFRLYSVLGRRTGNERPPQQDDFNVRGGMLPRRAESPTANAGPLIHGAADRPTDPVASGLFDIGLADRGFEKEHFINGAKAAYEMILTAFASGDRAALKPLLSPEVYDAFEGAIRHRESAGQKASLTLVGFSDVKIIAASLKNSVAEITLAFGSRLLSFTTDADGTVVEGDAKAVKDVTDVWTFTRDVRNADPNWLLVATSSEPQ
jgi:predicted lipid-binding transport protein (Tim44 family)